MKYYCEQSDCCRRWHQWHVDSYQHYFSHSMWKNEYNWEKLNNHFFSVRFSHFTGYHTFGNIWRWRKCIFQWNVWNITLLICRYVNINMYKNEQCIRGPPLATSLIMHIFAQYLFCACVTTYRMIYFSAFMQTPNLSFFISPASWHCLYVTC